MARGHCRVLRSGFSLTPRLSLLGALDGQDRWGGPPRDRTWRREGGAPCWPSVQMRKRGAGGEAAAENLGTAVTSATPPQVYLGKVPTGGARGSQVVVKELRSGASVQEQLRFLEEVQPYRWVDPSSRAGAGTFGTQKASVCYGPRTRTGPARPAPPRPPAC